MFLNARSIKKTEAAISLSLDLAHHNIDVCCLTETWLKSESEDSYIYIPDYILLRHGRNPENSNKSTGGGICAYIRSIFNVKKLTPNNCNLFEVLWLLVDISPPHILCVVYYPPLINRKEDYLDYLTKTFDEVLRQYPHAAFIIGGDFNDFDTGAIESSLGIHSVFTGVTHKRSQLDYVMVLQKALVKQCFSMKTTMKTDHLALVVKPRVPIPTVRRKVSSVINDITKDAN